MPYKDRAKQKIAMHRWRISNYSWEGLKKYYKGLQRKRDILRNGWGKIEAKAAYDRNYLSTRENQKKLDRIARNRVTILSKSGKRAVEYALAHNTLIPWKPGKETWL